MTNRGEIVGNGASKRPKWRLFPTGRTNAVSFAVVTEQVRRFVKQHERLQKAAEAIERAFDRVPGPLGDRLQSAKRRMFRETSWDQLLVLVDDLDSEGIRYWLAGGWGVDALLGRRTRPHRDVDIVIEDWAHNEPRIRRALLARGFEHVAIDQGGVWMPSRSNFEDAAGQRIEVLDIDWDLVGRSLGLEVSPAPHNGPNPDLAAEVLTTGEIEGRQLHCLTAAAQLLFHTGFPLEDAGESDMSLLRSEFGSDILE